MFKIAKVTSIVDGLKVQFTEDSSPSTLKYKRIATYTPAIGDTVLMLKINTTYICLGKVV
jgi:hypothetical protein